MFLTQLCMPVVPALANESVDGGVVNEVIEIEPEITPSSEATNEEIFEESPSVSDSSAEALSHEEETSLNDTPVENDEMLEVPTEVPQGEGEPIDETHGVGEDEVPTEDVSLPDDTSAPSTLDESTDASTTDSVIDVGTEAEETGDGSLSSLPAEDEDVTAPTTTEIALEVSEEVPTLTPEELELLAPTPQDDEVSPATSTENGTSTPLAVDAEAQVVILHDDQFVFDTKECARVADGSFYCKKDLISPDTTHDGLMAGPDRDGDNEIFFTRNGETVQLTENLVDDSAPFYDPLSESFVWHRLIGDRYQIVHYELTTDTETVLTSSPYNNMQPTMSGDYIVWQGWVGNDWEIFLKERDEIAMLTDNTTHDVGPRVNGTHIIWQAEEENGWVVHVYDITTKSLDTIDDTEGASIENPRMVLVYDAKHDNGDVETRGYNLETGEVVTLASEPKELPDELPDPDQTGEDRALISSTQLKVKTDDEEEGATTTEPLPLEPALEEDGDTKEVLDVVIPSFEESTTTESTPEAPIEIVPDTTLQDDTRATSTLVVPALENASLIETAHIPDVVVTPYEETVEAVTDSQVSVAES